MKLSISVLAITLATAASTEPPSNSTTTDSPTSNATETPTTSPTSGPTKKPTSSPTAGPTKTPTCDQCIAEDDSTSSLFGEPVTTASDLSWKNLTECTSGSLKTLGWTPKTWNGWNGPCSKIPETEETCWGQLMPWEKEAVVDICYVDPQMWDGLEDAQTCTYDYDVDNGDPCFEWDFTNVDWFDINYWDDDIAWNDCVRGALEVIGWTKEMWDCEDTEDYCCPVPSSYSTCWSGLNENQKCWLEQIEVDEVYWNSPDSAKPLRAGAGPGANPGQGQGASQSGRLLLENENKLTLRGSDGQRALKGANGDSRFLKGLGPTNECKTGQEKNTECNVSGDCCPEFACRTNGSGQDVCVPKNSNAFKTKQIMTCFSKDNKVDIRGKGLVSIAELKVGDEVLTEDGYSTVYGFGRRNEEEYVEYVKISLESGEFIELSPDHMLFVGASLDAYTADDVEVGDKLMLMPAKKLSKVIAVSTVTKQGSFHPYTYDGTIIANGIVASVYDAEPYHVNVQMFGTDIIDGHDFKHLMYGPLRLMCKIAPENFCGPKNHFDDDGSHHMVEFVIVMEHLLVPHATEDSENNFLRPGPFLPFNLLVLAVLLLISSVEMVLGMTVAVGLWAMFYHGTRTSPKKVKGGMEKSQEKKAA